MYPLPGDLKMAPVWENYAVAQVVQASLGLIPASALAFGVQVSGAHLRVLAQMSEPSRSDLESVGDIQSNLEDLVGPDVEIEFVVERVDERKVSPHDGTRWIYLHPLPS
jgi:hypothetical protein